MVYDQQSALEASGQSITLEDPGVFYFFCIMQQGHTVEEGEKSLQEEIERLKTQPVSTASSRSRRTSSSPAWCSNARPTSTGRAPSGMPR